MEAAIAALSITGRLVELLARGDGTWTARVMSALSRSLACVLLCTRHDTLHYPTATRNVMEQVPYAYPSIRGKVAGAIQEIGEID